MTTRSDPLDELLGDVGGCDLLDVGCGAGWLVRRMLAAGARAVGVDPLADALERARAEDPGAEDGRYREAGAQALPFADASFDIVVFFNSLHHVPAAQLDGAVAEAGRVLRPAGRLFVQEPLARGDFFELARPVDDETDIRAAAQEALDRAVASGALVERVRREEAVTMTLADFASMRAMMVGVDPARAAHLDAHEAELRAAFERGGRAVEGGREFDAPAIVRLLAPA